MEGISPFCFVVKKGHFANISDTYLKIATENPVLAVQAFCEPTIIKPRNDVAQGIIAW